MFDRTHKWNHLVLGFSLLGGLWLFIQHFYYYWSIQIFYFFLVQTWHVACFWEFTHSSRMSNLLSVFNVITTWALNWWCKLYHGCHSYIYQEVWQNTEQLQTGQILLRGKTHFEVASSRMFNVNINKGADLWVMLYVFVSK